MIMIIRKVKRSLVIFEPHAHRPQRVHIGINDWGGVKMLLAKTEAERSVENFVSLELV